MSKTPNASTQTGRSTADPVSEVMWAIRTEDARTSLDCVQMERCAMKTQSVSSQSDCLITFANVKSVGLEMEKFVDKIEIWMGGLIGIWHVRMLSVDR